MLSLLLAAAVNLQGSPPVKVAVLPADPASFDMPAEFGPHAADKAVLAGAQEVCVQPDGESRRRTTTCEQVRGAKWGFGDANTSIDLCEHEDVATMTSPRVSCPSEDVSVKVIDMTNVDCASDPCFVDVAKRAGATHLLRLVGFFRDTYSLEPTLSLSATVTRLSDGAVHLVRPHDVDPAFDSSRPRPAYQAMGILRWLARSAVAREVVGTTTAPPSGATPKPPLAVQSSPTPSPPPSPANQRPSVLWPAVVAGAGLVMIGSGVALWAASGNQPCGALGCSNDRRSDKVGIPLVVAGGLLALGGSYWLVDRFFLSASTNAVALSGRF